MQPITVRLIKNAKYQMARETTIIGNKMLAQDATLRCGKYSQLRRATALEGLGPCVGIAIWTPQRKFVAHSAPELDLPQFIEQHIEKVIKNLRETVKHSYDDLAAFICGGIENSEDKLSKASSELVNAYYEELMKHNIPTTVIAQQIGYTPNSRIDAYITNNSAFLTGNPIKTLESVEKLKSEEIESVLSKNFNFVKISSNVPVEISETNSKFLKKST